VTDIKGRAGELFKIVQDPLYFLRYVRIQEPGELERKYEIWPHLVEFFDALHKFPRIIVLKSKQIGISWALAVDTTKHILTVPGANVSEISNVELSAKSLLEKSQTVYNHLPEWLKNVGNRPFTRYPDSTEAFGLKEMRSQIRALTSTKTSSIGENLSRGIHDEADFHEYFEDNFAHTDPATRKGQLIVVSTADKTKPDSFFKNLYKNARAGKNDFKPFFFGALSRPDRDMEWYEREKEIWKAQNLLWMFEQNYPLTEEEALSPISAQSYFNRDILNTLWQNACSPEETRQGFIYIYQPWKPGYLYGAGVDVAEGVGLDYSVLTIIGKYGLSAEVVALIYSNTLSTDLFSYYISQLCGEYKNPLLFVENAGLGESVISRLLESKYPKLYYTGKEAGKEGKAGWTSSRNRKLNALNVLSNDVNDGSLITRFKPQVQEMMEYQVVDGYPQPTGATHGDTVISFMLADLAVKEVKPSVKPLVIYPRHRGGSFGSGKRY
jgi:hypothetical protein